MPLIIAVGTSIPEFVATNEYVVSLSLEVSRDIYQGRIDELEFSLRAFLKKVGCKERRWRAGPTKPWEHIRDAWRNCLAQLEDRSPAKIGTLIYCGIDRGFAEPSHASILAQRFGLDDVRTFDLSDACMGWFTAVQATSMFCRVEKPHVAIVSAEFQLEMPGKVYPPAFAIKNAEDLTWKGAALTLGEAASVTVIDSSVQVHNVFKSNSKFADLCCVPLIRAERFVDTERLLPRLSDDCFVAHMPTMAMATYRDAQEVLISYINEFGEPDIVLPHTISQSGPTHASKQLLKDGAVRNCFEFFGNIATSSIPVGYEYFGCRSDAKAHVVGWVSAAGMSHCAFKLS